MALTHTAGEDVRIQLEDGAILRIRHEQTGSILTRPIQVKHITTCYTSSPHIWPWLLLQGPPFKVIVSRPHDSTSQTMVDDSDVKPVVLRVGNGEGETLVGATC